MRRYRVTYHDGTTLAVHADSFVPGDKWFTLIGDGLTVALVDAKAIESIVDVAALLGTPPAEIRADDAKRRAPKELQET